jgi:hypothetical protein
MTNLPPMSDDTKKQIAALAQVTLEAHARGDAAATASGVLAILVTFVSQTPEFTTVLQALANGDIEHAVDIMDGTD